MAHFEFRLPDVGEGVAEGEVVAWHVEPDQLVREDDEMVEVMTDKATVSIGAPRAGRIVELRAQPGDVVKVGTVLVTIDTAHKQENGDSEGKKESAASAVGDIRDDLPGMQWLRQQRPSSVPAPAARLLEMESAGPAAESDAQNTAEAVSDDYFEAKPLATPATRKLARDLCVDLRRVRPTGAGGRVTKPDVRGHAPGEGNLADESRARDFRPEVDQRAPDEERQPFVGLRRRIAQRMHEATTKPASFTFVEEVQVDRLSQLVERLRPSAQARGVRLHYLPFIVKAVTLALAKHPMLNSMLDEERNELVMRRYYHIGIATATDQGLVVPVVRHADRKTPLQLAEEIQRLASGAREGGLHGDDLKGSTFTITSLGKQGGLLATPVLNYPEVGILGVHRIREKPVVRAGQIVIGQVMMLSLSLDHRIVDGHQGAAFAYDVIAYLENPDLLLLEMH